MYVYIKETYFNMIHDPLFFPTIELTREDDGLLLLEIFGNTDISARGEDWKILYDFKGEYENESQDFVLLSNRCHIVFYEGNNDDMEAYHEDVFVSIYSNDDPRTFSATVTIPKISSKQLLKDFKASLKAREFRLSRPQRFGVGDFDTVFQGMRATDPSSGGKYINITDP